MLSDGGASNLCLETRQRLVAEPAVAAAGYNRDLLLGVCHFPVEGSHRHPAHDAVGLRLIGAVDDVSFLLERQHRRGRRGAEYPVCGDRGALEPCQRDLDFADMLPARTPLDVGRIRGGCGLELWIAGKE